MLDRLKLAVAGSEPTRLWPERTAASPQYLAHVDGLRALAILFVVVFHAWPEMLPGGFIGVDVFFVISGFLITRLIASEMAHGEFSFAAFFARRVRRLFPAAILMVSAVLAVGSLILLPATLSELGKSLVYISFMIVNVHFYQTAGYFSAPVEEKPLLHMWTLAVEDQFYLTWPLLLVLLAAFLPRRGIIAVVIGLAVASFVHAQVNVVTAPDYAFYILWPRAWELLAGCILALVAPYVSVPARMAAVAQFAGLAMIFAAAGILHPGIAFPGLSVLPVVLGTVLAIAGGVGQTSLATRILASRPAVFIGLISYSLYLWHWPILSLSSSAMSRPLSPLETAAAVTASGLIAVLSWRFVERPFRRRSATPGMGQYRVIAAGAVPFVLLSLAGAGIRIDDGLPWRFDGSAGQSSPTCRKATRCAPPVTVITVSLAQMRHATSVAGSMVGNPDDIVVLGDSNGDQFVPAIARWASSAGLAGRQVTQSACAPLLGVHVPGRASAIERLCDPYHERIVRFVEDNAGLKLAVLGGAWLGYQGRLEDRGLEYLNPNATDEYTPRLGPTADFEAALARTIDYLIGRGIKVHIVAQISHFAVLPTKCILGRVAARVDAETCGIPSAEVLKRHHVVDEAIRRIARNRPGVTASFPSTLICRDQMCLPYRDGVYMYRNGGHLSRAGAYKIQDFLELPDLRLAAGPKSLTPIAPSGLSGMEPGSGIAKVRR